MPEPATFRWRLSDGKLPLYERHMRSLAARDFSAPLLAWARTRLEWTLDNLAYEHPDGIVEIVLDEEQNLDMCVHDARPVPEDACELGQRWDVFGDLLVPRGALIDATSTLVRDLAKTLHYRVEEDAQGAQGTEHADGLIGHPGETFYVSDEFGVVPQRGIDPWDGLHPVTVRMIGCFDKLWALKK